ncbi:MAG: RND transporter [Gammaproteobacteria bacterium]|nr:RND transporter [Gammaproteobacteria bacterium]
MKWIDRIPLLPLGLLAVFLGIAPLHPEPHLFEKTRMLIQGNLIRAIDIFDLFFHGSAPLLFIIRVIRKITRSKK